MKIVRSALAMMVLMSSVVGCGGGSGPDKTTEPVTPAKALTSMIVSVVPSTIQIGQTAAANASGKDQNGADFALPSLSWTSSAPGIATVTSTGVVSGVAPGNTSIIATSGNITAQQSVTVAPISVAVIALNQSIGSLVIGGTVQLSATVKDASNNVLADRTVVWSSSDLTKLTVSSTGFVTAVGNGTAMAVATVDGKSANAAFAITPTGTAITLTAVGQAQSFATSPNVNTALTVQTGAQYLVAIANTDASAISLSDFSLSTSFASATLPLASGSIKSAPVSNSYLQTNTATSQTTFPIATLANRQRAAASARIHLDMLQREFEMGKSAGNVRAENARLRAANIGIPQLAVSQTIGDINKVYVKKLGNGSCASVDSVDARTVAVGQKVIILADTNRTLWPQGLRPDSSYFKLFADEFDQVTYPHLLTYTGDPLAYDASLSGTGKVTMVFTPLLNSAAITGGGIVDAFVTACDLIAGAKSNRTEIVYFRIPVSGEPIAYWQASMRETAPHESKHLASEALHIINNNGFGDEVFLEEGLAQLSSEIWLRNYNHATWKGQSTFSQTVACEYTFSALGIPKDCPVTSNPPSGFYGDQMTAFFLYLQGQNTSAQGLSLGTYEGTYGGSWAFSRWITDQFASTGEATFVKRLINEPRLTGLASISALTGQSVAQLLSGWSLASAIIGPRITPADTKFSIPSFDFSDIFRVGQTNFASGGSPIGIWSVDGSRNPVYPVIPTAVASSTTSRTVNGVHGTSTYYFLITGSSPGMETLQLLNSAGGALSASSGLRLSIMRVQ